MIDLRSDTVTHPTAEMRRAMAEAEVGDDVYREDPTVRRLEERAAEMFGKEAALFVPTGTMGNTIAIKLHTQPGQEVICDDRAHILDWELAMTARFSSCTTRAVPVRDGILTWAQIEAVVKPPGGFFAPTALVHLEHPHNMGGGTLYQQEAIDEISGRSHGLGLRVHMDGARIFNAAAASGTRVDRIVRDVDTVMVCLSKGLCAPAGSLLMGSREAMEEGRHIRKALGGGMRQAGVLAAAGLVALEDMPARLPEDHAHAQLLACAVGLDRASVQTNIVIFEAPGDPALLLSVLRERGVLAAGVGGKKIRLVTHRDVGREACEQAAAILRDCLKHQAA